MQWENRDPKEFMKLEQTDVSLFLSGKLHPAHPKARQKRNQMLIPLLQKIIATETLDEGWVPFNLKEHFLSQYLP